MLSAASPASASSNSVQLRMAALASCTARTSAWVNSTSGASRAARCPPSSVTMSG